MTPILNHPIDHVVVGQGPPGGSWHRIDPNVLTLSLGSWMSLPEVPFPACTINEKRACSRDVAAYYEKYVTDMELTKYFVNDALVTMVKKIGDTEESRAAKKRTIWVKKLDRDVVERVKDYFVPVNEDSENRCFITNAINCLMSRNARRSRHCRRPRAMHQDTLKKINQAKSESILIPKHERKKSISCCSCCGETENNRSPKPLLHSQSLDTFTKPVPFRERLHSSICDEKLPRWLVQSTDVDTGEVTRYSCKYLVLACGSYDSPNRLEIFKNGNDPEWLMHDLRSLESRLDQKLYEGDSVDPVLIVGAGLSAADAVMAVRSRNIPVVHVFRGRSAEFTKQLPENMYPEYHKVRQMMNDGGSTYPLYTAYPEHSLVDFNSETQTVKLASKAGDEVKLKLSFAAVLIGSRPCISFMPPTMQLGIFADREIDSKTNPVEINPLTHEVAGQEGLFAVGPLAGDNFVRYIPGGAVAVVSELYRRWNLVES
ncbi:hypothetical protein D910_04886 [Dendroctonus ponderosae]|uniref:FAD/NAD(P)-binding domain-containing protein n=1 Tax=Dendroctonus ponderosae TaxID=77166 RepID=U4U0V6_DENPD|nr:hypothetical protein D910_04886 [Dendroctonus ponderosae]